MTDTKTVVPVAVGAKIDAGPWLTRFEISCTSTMLVLECTADRCEWQSEPKDYGTNMLDVWNEIQRHMFEAHLDLGEGVDITLLGED